MKPIYEPDFYPADYFDFLKSSDNIPWINNNAPRNECFMSKVPRTYTYGKFPRSYTSVPMILEVMNLMNWLNAQDFGEVCYNVCFLNYYASDKEHLGWHADEFEGADDNHPIAVISYGQAREIWVKPKGYTGVIPKEDRYLLENRSLFVMPAGFQKDYLHKIPKGDRPMSGRISLTFRRFI